MVENETPRERCIRVYEEQGPIRFVLTHVNRSGVRTLLQAQQGRYTYATAEEAQALLDAIRPSYAARPETDFDAATMEVRPVECWPVHHDPKRIWFDLEDTTEGVLGAYGRRTKFGGSTSADRAEDAERSRRERLKRRSWRCGVCGKRVPCDHGGPPRKHNRACSDCRETRADDVADLKLGLRFS